LTSPLWSRWTALTIAILVAALGALPIASWVPGGLTDPGYSRRWLEWGYGSSICAGAAILFAILGGSTNFAASVSGLRARASDRIGRHPWRSDLAAAAICLLVYVITALSVLDAKPLLIDEIVQVLQARTYASGQLSSATDSARAFFSVLHVVDIGERTYSQFPPGWPAMLALASLAKVEWLAGPVCGAVAVLLFARLLRRVFPAEPLTAFFGALLFGLAPLSVFQFASHMSHGPVVMWLLLATLFLTRTFAVGTRSAVGDGAAAGLAAGAAFAVRPLDAVAFIVPAAVWIFARAARDRSARLPALAAAAGAFLPLCAVLWVNANTTGNPLQFGYSALWGPSHGLGFHAAPWGDAHTPARGLELLSVYVTRLNSYLFETPFPSLLPAIAALCFIPRLTAIERFLAAAVLVHAAFYFSYWHDGFYLGPRFVVPWIPLLVLLSIRFLRVIDSSRVDPRVRRGIIGACSAAVLLAAAVALPVRVSQYQSGLTSMRTDYAAEAARAGVTNAVVFVKESWGSQLVARMWELGISRAAVAALYAKVDACVLEHEIRTLENAATRGMQAERALEALLTDSQRVRASTVSPDTTERMLPGAVYDAECSAQVSADQAGYALYPPFLLDNSSGNMYVRDLGNRDSAIVRRFAGRRAFRVSRHGVDGSAPLVWTEIPHPDRARD
jgi:hypothetical protein